MKDIPFSKFENENSGNVGCFRKLLYAIRQRELNYKPIGYFLAGCLVTIVFSNVVGNFKYHHQTLLELNQTLHEHRKEHISTLDTHATALTEHLKSLQFAQQVHINQITAEKNETEHKLHEKEELVKALKEHTELIQKSYNEELNEYEREIDDLHTHIAALHNQHEFNIQEYIEENEALVQNLTTMEENFKKMKTEFDQVSHDLNDLMNYLVNPTMFDKDLNGANVLLGHVKNITEDLEYYKMEYEKCKNNTRQVYRSNYTLDEMNDIVHTSFSTSIINKTNLFDGIRSLVNANTQDSSHRDNWKIVDDLHKLVKRIKADCKWKSYAYQHLNVDDYNDYVQVILPDDDNVYIAIC